MIARDWQRLGFNLLLGPPIAYIVGLGAVCVWLIVVSDGPQGSASWVPTLLVVFIPGITIGYVFGLLPALINSVVTSVLARFIRSKLWRLLTSLPSGVFATWLGAGWVLGMGGQQFDSDYLALLLSVCVPIGGAVASLCCTALVERFGSTKGMAETAQKETA
jgi:hypothetical protein